MSKFCPRCSTLKQFDEFKPSNKRKDGRDGICRICSNELNREYKKRNKSKIEESRKEYKQANKTKIKLSSKDYYIKNKDHIKTRNSEYNKNNRDLCNAKLARYRAKKKNQTHKDYNNDIALSFYEHSQRVSRCLGIRYQVDHILPINKGGYHHHGNLQSIPAHFNESKQDNLDYRNDLLIHWSQLPPNLLDQLQHH